MPGFAHRVCGLVALVVLGLATAGCSDKPTEQDCKALLDRLVELELATAGTDKLSADMKADLDKQAKELREYLGGQFMERCLKETPVAVVKCGLKAKSKADYAGCEKQ